MWKSKKNGFLAKIAWHYLCQEGRKKRAFSCTLSVLAKNFFGPKQCKSGKTIKISGFSGNCPKPKMTPFLWKRCFLTWVKKVGFTNCVFEKLCFFFWKHYLYSVFSKTQLFKSKNGMLKKTKKLWKIVGCFWTWQNGVFWVCFFWGFNVIVVCFGVFGITPEAKICLFFPVCWPFVGWFILVYLGFGRFRCFCVSCVCFCFLCCFCFCFVCFVFVLLLDCFLVLVLVLLLFLFFFFVLVLFLFLFFFVLFFWRV